MKQIIPVASAVVTRWLWVRRFPATVQRHAESCDPGHGPRSRRVGGKSLSRRWWEGCALKDAGGASPDVGFVSREFDLFHSLLPCTWPHFQHWANHLYGS